MWGLRIAAGAAVLATTSMLTPPIAAADSEPPLHGELAGSVSATPCGPGTLCLSGSAEGVVSRLGYTTLTKSATVQFSGQSCGDGGSASTFTETVRLVAANGDTLQLSGNGTACMDAGHALGTASLAVVDGTGRFENATGTVTETFDHTLSDHGEVIDLEGTVER